MKQKLWPFKLYSNFTFGNSLSGVVKLTKNLNPDKYCYTGYGVGFDSRGLFCFQMVFGLVKYLK